MKLICDGLDLSDAVLKVSKALSVKAANPILEGIKITARGDTLTLLATDTELTIENKLNFAVYTTVNFKLNILILKVNCKFSLLKTFLK